MRDTPPRLDRGTAGAFAEALLKRDPPPPAGEYDQYRRSLARRLRQAERREKLARTVSLAVFMLAPISLCVAMLVDRSAVPHWARAATSLTATVLMMAAGPLLVLYFLRHRRAAQSARDEWRDAASAEAANRRPPPAA